VAQRIDTLDLASFDLRPGGGTTVDAEVAVAPIRMGGQDYGVGAAGSVQARLDVSRTISGYAFRLRFGAPLEGPCMRCLTDARPVIEVDTREVEQPGDAEDLHTPYLDNEGRLELREWVRDALMLALPSRLLCREDCRGLCPVCGIDLNTVDADEHRHESAADPRWAKLSELELDQ
jgi:uncharacterized protein